MSISLKWLIQKRRYRFFPIEGYEPVYEKYWMFCHEQSLWRRTCERKVWVWEEPENQVQDQRNQSGVLYNRGCLNKHGNWVTTGHSNKHGKWLTTGCSNKHGKWVTTGCPTKHGKWVSKGCPNKKGNLGRPKNQFCQLPICQLA